MARREVFTNSLATGEIAPEFLSRSDMAARSSAAKTLRNVVVLPGGGVRRRGGTRYVNALNGPSRLLSVGIGPAAQIVAFQSGQVWFIDQAGNLLQAVGAAPWGTGDLHTMQVVLEDDRIIVTSNAWPPQLLTNVAGSWVLSAFSFASGAGGITKQPYYRFQGYAGVTIAPSAYTGSVSLVASSALFAAGHVGTIFRYSGVEMLVTAVADSTHATATITGNLYPTITATVVSSDVFLVGQEVSGLDSSTKGIVVAVPDATHVTVQLTGGYSYFNWTSGTVSEKIVSPTGVAAQGAAAPVLEPTPAASVVWDEQVVSSVRGYPGSCALHRTRLLLGDFPNAPNLVCGSALGDITDFAVGTGLDTDAIVELIGLVADVGVRHFGSTEQLLFFTQSGSLYVPEQVGAPLSPTNFELLKIGPEAAGLPVPILVSEGMLFVEDRSGRVMAAVPTGNVRRSWQIADMSELAFHLMGNPVEIGLLAAVTNTDRKVILVRDDGALAVMTYRRGESVSAWALWETIGAWESGVVVNGALYLAAARTINGLLTHHLEVVDDTVYGDGVVSIATPTTPVTLYASQTVSVWNGPAYLGDFPMNGAGVLVGVSDTYGALQVGFDSQVQVELVPPIDGTDGLRRKLRICRVDVETVASGPMRVNGYDPSGFVNAAGVGGSVQMQSGTRRFRTLGRSVTGTVNITQDHAGPFEVRSVTTEVTS